MRHHCINKKRSRMEVYNGNKQDSRICVGATRTKHVANGCSIRTIARWTDYGHYGNYGPQYEIHIFHTEYEYQIYPLSSAVRMFHVQFNISNRTPQSGVLLQDVTVAQLVNKFPVNYATQQPARRPSLYSARHISILTSHLCPRRHIGLCHLGWRNKIL
jgi:hypothetical protein